MRTPGLLTLLAVGLLTGPGVARAHLVNTGLGPFYDGALHLLLSPGELLGLAAAALLAGRNGRSAARLTVIVLPLAWLSAGLIGLSFPVAPEVGWLGLSFLVVLGVLVVLEARLLPTTIALLGGLYGVVHGLVDGSTLAAVGAGASNLLGIVLAVLLLILLTSAAVVPLQAFWARVLVRVAGSWVVATGILMFAWLAQGSA